MTQLRCKLFVIVLKESSMRDVDFMYY
jgi:hypothetical protein